MRPSNNQIERYKAEKNGLDILNEIEKLAAQHEGWETIEASDRERLKWLGIFFREPTPGLLMIRIRITNGQATAAQLHLLAILSRQFGNGILDLTTRQQIQLRAVRIRDIPQILAGC